MKKVLLAQGGETLQWRSAKYDYLCSNRLGHREGLTIILLWVAKVLKINQHAGCRRYPVQKKGIMVFVRPKVDHHRQN